MKRVVVVTPADAAYGFSLSRVIQLTCVPRETEDLLRQVLAEPDIGVVAVDERLLAGVDETRLREMERRWPGVLVVLPAPVKAGAEEEEDYALRLIRRAIGYHVRLQR
jgi:V/A-type H+-transporting ATPase subunit F